MARAISTARAFLRLARQLFLNLAVVLLLFFLPFDFLFRISSWSLFMPGLDLVAEVAMLTTLLALGSVALAVLGAGIGCAIIAFSTGHTAARIEGAIADLAAVASLALIALIQLRALKIVVQGAIGPFFSLGMAKFLLLPVAVASFALWARKRNWSAIMARLRSDLARGNRVVLGASLSAVLIVGVRGVTLDKERWAPSIPVASRPTGMPNVILVSIDTLAAGDMSLYGYHLATTPRLKDFASESYVFDHFFSVSNWTTPGVASLLSGLYPITSGVDHIRSYFLTEDRNKNLAHVLEDSRYQSAAIAANGYADPAMLRIADSFSVVTPPSIIRRASLTSPVLRVLHRLQNYRTYWWMEDLVAANTPPPVVAGDDEESYWRTQPVLDRALRVADNLAPPYFLWVHILTPHYPYLPVAPFEYTFGKFNAYSTVKDYEHEPVMRYSNAQQSDIDRLRLRYDEFVLDTDSRVGAFLDALKAKGRFDDSVIIITADHGESFTKNWFTHGGPLLHQALVHIPLLVHLPAQRKGVRVPLYSSQVDLLPTVLDVLGLPIPNWVDGESLKPALLEGRATTRPRFAMNLEPDSRFAPPSKGTVAIMLDGWKMVRYLSTRTEELYDLASDPEETTDLVTANPRQASVMRNALNARFKLAK